MFPIDSIKDNNHNDIIKEPISPTRIHEHDFISIKTEKEQTSILCSTCRSLYCEKCGKLVIISDQNYICSIISITSNGSTIEEEEGCI
jgi:tRNA uridine 5-carbamoylmethylation protein Kti12